MPEDSARHGVVVTLQVLLAMLFLAIIGGVAGYLAGGRVKDHRQPSRPVGAAVGDHGGGTATATPPSGPRCLQHTEELAGAGWLRQVLYLHTRQSEVWICATESGRLFYQGHRGQPGDTLIEGKNALFLTDVAPEPPNGYVATNRDPAGQVTEYHVDPQKLVQHFINYASPRPDRTEPAVRS